MPTEIKKVDHEPIAILRAVGDVSLAESLAAFAEMDNLITKNEPEMFYCIADLNQIGLHRTNILEALSESRRRGAFGDDRLFPVVVAPQEVYETIVEYIQMQFGSKYKVPYFHTVEDAVLFIRILLLKKNNKAS